MTQKTLLAALCAPLLLAACGGGNTNSTQTKLMAASEQAAAPADQDDGGPLTLARCYSNPLFLTEGASYEVDGNSYYPGGTSAVTSTAISTVKGKTTFNGYDAVPTDVVITDSYGDVFRYLNYENTTETSRVMYGSQMSLIWNPADIVAIYAPPIETPLNLGVNQTFEQTYISNFTLLGDQGWSWSTNTKRKVTFLGFETVKVPAGTFRTCKVQESEEELDVVFATPQVIPVTTQWVVANGKYAGFIIKTDLPAYGTSFEATNIKINSPGKS